MPSPKVRPESQSTEEAPESGAACGTGGCPPSHRLARRVSTAIIAVLIALILVAALYVALGNRA